MTSLSPDQVRHNYIFYIDATWITKTIGVDRRSHAINVDRNLIIIYTSAIIGWVPWLSMGLGVVLKPYST